MNFAGLKRPSFGRAQPEEAHGVPPGLTRKAIVRRTAMLAEAKEVLAHLPGPGEALHALMTGRYDLMHLLLVLIERLGGCDDLQIATLSFNMANVAEMAALLDSARVKRLSVLCSKFFRENSKAIYQYAHDELTKRGQRLAFSRNHCKVVCVAASDGRRLVLEGSANLRTNSNIEQFCLVNDPELHDWHATWIEKAMATHAQGNERSGRPTG
jgi:hypothetical protein